MSAAVVSAPHDEHGLSYPPEFLSSLPVLSPPLPPSTSSSTSPGLPTIRALTASQFADMHMRYLTTHAPDSVIFPFLHGLEGDNDAQNAFFYANGSYSSNGGTVLGKDGVDVIDREKLKARVPRFRGLAWVASDEDEVEEYERAIRARRHAAAVAAEARPSSSSATSASPSPPITSHSPSHANGEDDLDIDVDDDLEEDDYSTSSLDDDDDDEEDEDESDEYAQMPMEVDGPIDLVGPSSSPHHPHGVGVVGMDVDLTGEGEMGVRVDMLDHNEGTHMHPSVPRSRPTLSAIDTGAKDPVHTQTHHRLSNASSTSSFTSSTSTSPPPSASTSASPSFPTPPTPSSSLPELSATPPSSSSSSSECTSVKAPATPTAPERVTLTSTFKPRDLLCIDRETGETRFVEPRVPEGISLRNFGIQVPIFATLSDIVVYSPRGNTKAALAVASHFAHAIEAKRRQRAARGQKDLLHYNVFVLSAKPEDMVRDLPHVVSRMADEVVGSGAHTTGTDAHTVSETHPAPHSTAQQLLQQHCLFRRANTISFAQREKDEMRELTQASEILTLSVADDEERQAFAASTTASRWDPTKGQVFLGNSSDVPLPQSSSVGVGGRRGFEQHRQQLHHQDEWDIKANDPVVGMGYDICIECDDMAPLPSQAHMRAAEEHVAKLERRWAERCLKEMEREGASVDESREMPLRPPPSANLVVHLPFPSSVAYAGNGILPFVAWLEGLIKPLETPLTIGAFKARKQKEVEAKKVVTVSSAAAGPGRPSVRRSTNAAAIGYADTLGFGGPSSLPPPSAFPTSFLPPGGASPVVPITTTASAYTRMRSTSATHLSTPSPTTAQLPSLRTRPLKILIYSADGYTESSSLALSLLMSLRSLTLPEAYLELQVEKRRSFFVYTNEIAPLKRIEAKLERERMGLNQHGAVTRHGRPAAMSVSFAPSSIPTAFLSGAGPSTSPGSLAGHSVSSSAPNDPMVKRQRARASTLPPPLSAIGDHQSWFNDPRFDGSFPSRVLPFLYLGNLNHAANAYMLHALGITHVVSVGECALIPPENGHSGRSGEYATAKPGSLWIEEREGRIKVLDIKGVCDDGIDSLEPQLPPICEWIDEARRSGGKVLVHCRVGVSRSATVTIAYVMKHLNIPLVDAYLIVRSRRLSVLIQPNMRLLYNLLGWEVKLAQERAGNDQMRLRDELARCLNWPYLAKEVHALNEKYLH